MSTSANGTEGVGATAALAALIAGNDYDSLSGTVRHEAKRALLNWVGCALGGARSPPVEIAVVSVRPFAGTPQAVLINRPERLDAGHAALINAVSSNILDFDDTHLRTVIHPSVPVASAVLALGEYVGTSGRDLLHAFVLGVEAECRVGNAMSPEHYDAGWHVTATCGVIGAAAACAKLLGLDAARTCHALSMAASQAGGLSEMLGGMTRMLNMGRVARDGLLCALLASNGYTSSVRGIEAPRGYLNAFSSRRDSEEIARPRDGNWELEQNAYKPYPCGIVGHPAIDACLDVRADHSIDPGAIEAIELRVHPLVLTLMGRKDPRDELQAKLSVYHCAACAFLFGTVGVREFTDAVVLDPSVALLRARVVAVIDEDLAKNAAAIRVMLKDGRCLSKHVEHAKGSIERPMSDRELERKFAELADWGGCGGRVQQLLDLLWSLDSAPDLSSLTQALARS